MTLGNLFPKLEKFFSPRIIGEVNDVYIKIAKIKGDDVPWHTHVDEDELFYIVRGNLVMELEDTESFKLSEGEMYIINKGLKHRVYSEDECWILLVEQKSTKHTGDVTTKITMSEKDQLGE
jgi:quercetin dioxygenase-like cupin family protein